MMEIAGKLTLALGLAMGMAPTAHADSFTCPTPSQSNPAADAAMSKVIKGSRIDAGTIHAIRNAASGLRSAGASNSTIVDHAVVSYCDILVKDKDLSVQEKQSALGKFAAQMTASVYSPDQDSIFLSVAVPSALADRVDLAAAQSGQTTDAWVRSAIESKIAH